MSCCRVFGRFSSRSVICVLVGSGLVVRLQCFLFCYSFIGAVSEYWSGVHGVTAQAVTVATKVVCGFNSHAYFWSGHWAPPGMEMRGVFCR